MLNLAEMIDDQQHVHRAILRTEIESIASNRACMDGSDCSFVPLGSKPCGGPWDYLVYSMTGVNLELLWAEVEAYNAFEREPNIR